MKIRTLLAICIAFGLIGNVNARMVENPDYDPTDNAIPQPGQRNILIFIADDMGIDRSRQYRSITGNSLASLPITPNIRALADSGVTFDNAWANPVCSPTRAGLLTGRHSFRNTVANALSPGQAGLPDNEETLPELLAGPNVWGVSGTYTSGLFGKWHLGPGDGSGPTDQGFDEYQGNVDGELPDTESGGMVTDSGYELWDKYVNGVHIGQVTDYATWANADDAIGWINAQDNPWLAIVAFNAPHTPLHTPDQTTCERVSDPVQEDFNGMVHCMDNQIGRFFTELSSEELEKTTIIFIGDNGTESDQLLAPFDANPAGLSHKKNVYEGGIRVPFIVADGYHLSRGTEAPTTSGIGRIRNPGRRDHALVHTVDIFATVAAIAGFESEAEDSFSLVPFLAPKFRHPVGPLREWNYTDRCQAGGASPKFQAAIRNQVHKLIYELDDPGTGGIATTSLYAVTDLAEENEIVDVALTNSLLIEMQALWATGGFDPVILDAPRHTLIQWAFAAAQGRADIFDRVRRLRV